MQMLWIYFLEKIFHVLNKHHTTSVVGCCKLWQRVSSTKTVVQRKPIKIARPGIFAFVFMALKNSTRLGIKSLLSAADPGGRGRIRGHSLKLI